ncbi:hypothetical protein [Collimonas antrihumi]|uniref:hypothetical protein n=1 Tax=Collimonas antrihumi TaxID=1940615 RepID=UPI001B8AB49B|nr:hypothetical protein [Collimonas antrihumi]
MGNLTLRYHISLASNIAKNAAANAKAFEQASKRQNKAMNETDKVAAKTDKTMSAVGKKTEIARLEREMRRASVVLDRTGESAKRLQREIDRLGTGTSIQRTNMYLMSLGRRMETVREQAKKMGEAINKGSEVAAGVGAGVIAGAVTTGAIAKAPAIRANQLTMDANAEGRGSTSEDYKLLEKRIKESTNKTALDYFGSIDEVRAMRAELVRTTSAMSSTDAEIMQNSIQKTATATGSSVAEVTAVAIAAIKSFLLQPDQIYAALSKANLAGQMGGFDFKEQVKVLPQLLADLNKDLGMAGIDDFNEVITYMQGAFKGAGGDAGIAAMNVRMLASRLAAPETNEKFRERGYTYDKDVSEKMDQGLSRLAASMQYMEEALLKDQQYAELKIKAAAETDELVKEAIINKMIDRMKGSVIGEIFTDRKTRNALVTSLVEKETVKSIRNETNKDNGQQSDEWFNRNKETTVSKAKRARTEVEIASSNVFEKVEPAIQSMITGATQLAATYPGVTTGAFGVVSAFAIFKAAMMGSGILKLLSGKATGPGVPVRVTNMTAGLGGLPDAPGGSGKGGKAGKAGGFVARNAGLLRKLGWMAPVAMSAYEVGSALTDSDKSAAEKANAVGRTAAGAAGAWSGAKVGAAVGTLGGPAGTAIGGLVGGGLGWLGATSLGDRLNRPHYSDHPALQPDAAYKAISEIPLQKTEVDLKEGRLRIGLTVTDSRVESNLTVLQQFNGVHMDLGNTNPGGF